MSKTYCRPTNSGYGLFALKNIYRGDIIGRFEGDFITDVNDWRTKYLLQIAPKLYVAPRKPPHLLKENDQVWFTNHSCHANSSVIIVDKIFLVADKDIETDQEITFDYSTTQTEPWHMFCRCGESDCRMNVGTIKTLPLFTMMKYLWQGKIPNYAKKHYFKNFWRK